jgi:putative transposase
MSDTAYAGYDPMVCSLQMLRLKSFSSARQRSRLPAAGGTSKEFRPTHASACSGLRRGQSFGMPDYLRYRVPGGTYFFTITLLERGGDLLVRHINVLREAVRRTRAERPFHIDAWVVMPDHIHCVLTLPPGDADFSNRIKAIKIRFSRGVPRTERRSEVRAAKGERGIWQRRFWEHAIRDECDYAHHMDYVHFNPVKHGLVASVADWPHSTFHRCVTEGLYPADWGKRT